MKKFSLSLNLKGDDSLFILGDGDVIIIRWDNSYGEYGYEEKFLTRDQFLQLLRDLEEFFGED
jgi:hypothetical protein